MSQNGDRPAVITRSASPASIETIFSYYELDLLSNRLASTLASLGVKKGQKVAISLGNGPEFAALTYAVFKLGAILVPLNPTFNATQVQSALNHLQAETLIIGAVSDVSYKPGNGRSNEETLRQVVGDIEGGALDSEAVPSLKRVAVVDNRISHPSVNFDLDKCRRVLMPYRTLLEGSDRNIKPDQPLDPADIINIQFTSGTTSTPKAAQLTHTGILNNGMLIANRLELNHDDRIVVPPPLFHCFGSILGYMATATTGAAILFPSPAFDPTATIKMCVDHSATGLYGVATMIIAIMDAMESGAVSRGPTSLRKGIVSGSSVPESLAGKIFDRIGMEDFNIAYGMTETSPVNCMTHFTDPLAKRTSTVGTPMPHTTVKIVDPLDRSKILPYNTRGELATAGYLVMEGYYGDPERTAEVRIKEDDGRVWMYSGDEAEMDEQGFIKITGRIKDLIIRGGENIHPVEVENCLFQHPGVNEVSVAGVPDEKLGEAVAAFVIPHKGWATGKEEEEGKEHYISEAGVRSWVRSNLSSHLVPKYVFWVDEYPKTGSGKIQKFKLQELAKKLLAEEAS